MLRYIAFAWNPQDPAQTDATRRLTEELRCDSRGLRCALNQPGLVVFCDASSIHKPQLLAGGTGVLMGTVFRSAADTAIKTQSALESDHRIVATAGRSLIDSYWGHYVAFWCDPGCDRKWILRDPTGAIECLTLIYQGVSVFFSSVEECLPVSFLTFSVNWEYVATQLCYPMAETRETGLNEVSRVLGGECIEITNERTSRTFYWHPFHIARSGLIEDERQAVEAVRETTRACVRAWASRFDRILLMLSGGLDSSIVLSCLHDAPGAPEVTCLNYHYSRGANNDERPFARLAAGRFGCALVEREMQLTSLFQSALRLRPRVSPYDFISGLPTEMSMLQTARDSNASAIFRGVGGDELFCQGALRYACTDYVAHRGIRPALAGIAMRTARIERLSVWRVLGTALREALLSSPQEITLRRFSARSLVRSEVAAAVTPKRLFLHPWLTCSDPPTPGKYWHALTLSLSNDMTSALAGDARPAEVCPLLSQPLIELCLRIPTYVLATNGWDRAVARRAFEADVPSEIIWRRSKGVVDEYTKHLIAANIGYLRNLLLDGILTRERLLDRPKLEAALSGKPTKGFGYSTHLCLIAATEIWLAQWIRPQAVPETPSLLTAR